MARSMAAQGFNRHLTATRSKHPQPVFRFGRKRNKVYVPPLRAKPASAALLDPHRYACTVTTLHSPSELDKWIHELEGVVVVAKYCSSSRFFEPQLQHVARLFPGLTIVRINGDDPQMKETFSDFNVLGTPAFYYFRNGKQVKWNLGPDLNRLIHSIEETYKAGLH